LTVSGREAITASRISFESRRAWRSGSAPASQAGCRGFESLRPLQYEGPRDDELRGLFLKTGAILWRLVMSRRTIDILITFCGIVIWVYCGSSLARRIDSTDSSIQVWVMGHGLGLLMIAFSMSGRFYAQMKSLQVQLDDIKSKISSGK
jgi:hypothetical protein